MCLPDCGPSRLWAFQVVGLPGCRPPRFRSFPVVVLPVCGPSRSRILRRSPSRLLLRRNILHASFWVCFLWLTPLCTPWAARFALPAPFFSGRPVCFARADGCCPLRWLSCQIFFERAPVAFSRRLPLRRHFFRTGVRFLGYTPVFLGRRMAVARFLC